MLVRKLVLLLGLFIVAPAYSQVQVTFNVDMSQVSVSPQGVHVAGSFQHAAGLGTDWDPASTLMLDPDGDKIFSITVSVPTGYYEYKFVNGNNWDVGENPPPSCTVSSFRNRYVTVNGAVTIPPVRYNDCNALLKVSVNLNGATPSPQGVHVMGDFQTAVGGASNWDPASAEMTDSNLDGNFEASFWLPAGTYHYRFVNGNSLSDAETVPVDCSVPVSSFRAREAMVSLAPSTARTSMFGTCLSRDAGIPATYSTSWWNSAVFYEIFVRSFYDSNGDGIGDLNGLTAKLDYLNDGDPATNSDLGITAIWLMPIMKAASYHGYDVSDYYTIEPDYGTMADFENFLSEAHSRGIRVIVDMVLNHTSDQHEWFQQSAAANPTYRDWYVWSASNPGFMGPWGQTVWHPKNGAYYYGIFWSGMPDLNFRKPEVREEMFDVVRFWLNKGVDGFRLDAISTLVEDGQVMLNTPETLSYLEDLRTVYKSENPEALTVGEVWQATSNVIPYVQSDRLDLCFEFDLASAIVYGTKEGNALQVRSKMNEVVASYPYMQYATFLSNHDQDRVFSVLGSDAKMMKQAAALYLTFSGVPFLYYGEEIGQTGSGVDENKRKPMQWTNSASGFTTGSTWASMGDNIATNNVALATSDPSSLLSVYRQLIRMRLSHPSLTTGYIQMLPTPTSSLLAYARVLDNEAVVVVSNFGAAQSPSFTFGESRLLPGDYFITDILGGRSLGTVSVNIEGGIGSWSSDISINPHETWVLLISKDEPVVTGLRDVARSISVYPNPASAQLDIQTTGFSDRGEFILYDVAGLEVMKGECASPSTSVSIQGLASGFYVLKYTNGNYSTIRRVLIGQGRK